MTTIDSWKIRLSQIEKEMKKQGKQEIKKAFADLFAKYPELKAVFWAQYTPHFMDGDECVFSVNNMNLLLEDEDTKKLTKDELTEFCLQSYHNGDTEISALPAGSLKDELKTIEKTFQGLEDLMRIAYGDHVFVCVSSSGIQLEEYEHE